MVLSFSKVIRTTGQTKARLLRVAASRAMNEERQAAPADTAASVVDAIRAGSVMVRRANDRMPGGHKPESGNVLIAYRVDRHETVWAWRRLLPVSPEGRPPAS